MDFSSDPPRDEGDVVVTLKAGNKIDVPSRRIILTHQKPSVHVGRASKVPSKGFVAKTENAWFESPVMSRKHAELTANFDDKSLSIQDIGSLHGTFYGAPGNEKRLSAREPVVLANGDQLRFGIDIFRQHQTFPPCTVEIQMEWSQPREQSMPSQPSVSAPKNTFAVPDFDDEMSDGESDIVESPFHNRINQVDSIDLTGESPPPPSANRRMLNGKAGKAKPNSNIIDLTSEPDCDSDRESHNQDHRDTTLEQKLPQMAEASIHSDGDAVETHAVGYLDSDVASNSDASETRSIYNSEENSDFRNEAPVMREVPFTESVVAESSAMPIPSAGVWDYSEDESGSNASLYDSDEVSDTDLLRMHTDDVSDMSDDVDDNSEDDSQSDMDDQTSILSMGEDDGETSVEGESSFNRDPYFDGDFSSDSEYDIETSVFDTQLPAQDSSSSPIAQPAKAATVGTYVPSAFPIASPPNFFLGYPQPSAADQVNGAQSTIPRPTVVPHFTPIFDSAANPAVFTTTKPRQPSPSDAAMVKSSVPAFQTPLDSTSAAQVLGEKTGKPEYFAARKDNRAVVMARPPSPVPAVSAVRETLAENKAVQPVDDVSCIPAGGPFETVDKTSTWKEPTPVSDAAPKPRVATSESNVFKPVTSLTSAWTASGDAFINNPPVLKERSRLQSPDLDMTSAFSYHHSKVLAKPTNTRRLPLGIRDLLEPKDTSPVSEAYSSVKQAITTKPIAPLKSVGKPVAASKMEASIKVASPRLTSSVQIARPPKRSFDAFVERSTNDIVAEQSKVARDTPATSERPAKRRYIELATCLALGGAAVLSALISTAPQF